jgi:hypothetical protein
MIYLKFRPTASFYKMNPSWEQYKDQIGSASVVRSEYEAMNRENEAIEKQVIVDINNLFDKATARIRLR